jgi:hypothetical protein
MAACQDVGVRRQRGGKWELFAFHGEGWHRGRETEWLVTFNGEEGDAVRCSLWQRVVGMQEKEDDVSCAVQCRVC